RHLLVRRLSAEELLQRLPFTTKADIKQQLERYVSTEFPRRQRLTMYTGGSTANPMRFYLQRHVSRAREQAFIDDFHARIGLRSDDTVLALRGRSVPSAAQPKGKLWMYDPIKRQLLLSADHLETEYMPRYVEALQRFHPSVVEAFPSAL